MLYILPDAVTAHSIADGERGGGAEAGKAPVPPCILPLEDSTTQISLEVDDRSALLLLLQPPSPCMANRPWPGRRASSSMPLRVPAQVRPCRNSAPVCQTLAERSWVVGEHGTLWLHGAGVWWVRHGASVAACGGGVASSSVGRDSRWGWMRRADRAQLMRISADYVRVSIAHGISHEDAGKELLEFMRCARTAQGRAREGAMTLDLRGVWAMPVGAGVWLERGLEAPALMEDNDCSALIKWLPAFSGDLERLPTCLCRWC